jgi:hypothetical protein
MAIGCKQFPIEKWLSLSAEEISNLDTHASEFNEKWGDIIRQILKVS